jgi:hypothetical protein
VGERRWHVGKHRKPQRQRRVECGGGVLASAVPRALAGRAPCLLLRPRRPSQGPYLKSTGSYMRTRAPSSAVVLVPPPAAPGPRRLASCSWCSTTRMLPARPLDDACKQARAKPCGASDKGQVGRQWKGWEFGATRPSAPLDTTRRGPRTAQPAHSPSPQPTWMRVASMAARHGPVASRQPRRTISPTASSTHCLPVTTCGNGAAGGPKASDRVRLAVSAPNSVPCVTRAGCCACTPIPLHEKPPPGGRTMLRMTEAISATRLGCSVSTCPRKRRPSGRRRKSGLLAACSSSRFMSEGARGGSRVGERPCRRPSLLTCGCSDQVSFHAPSCRSCARFTPAAPSTPATPHRQWTRPQSPAGPARGASPSTVLRCTHAPWCPSARGSVEECAV